MRNNLNGNMKQQNGNNVLNEVYKCFKQKNPQWEQTAVYGKTVMRAGQVVGPEQMLQDTATTVCVSAICYLVYFLLCLDIIVFLFSPFSSPHHLSHGRHTRREGTMGPH